jgi:hypothetical protein
MAKRTEILGDKAPEEPWKEIVALRERIAALEAEKEDLQDKCATLATSLRAAGCISSPRGRTRISEVLRETGYEA